MTINIKHAKKILFESNLSNAEQFMYYSRIAAFLQHEKDEQAMKEWNTIWRTRFDQQ